MEERIYHLQSSAQESRLQLGEQKATLMAHATELRADLKVMRDRMDTMTRRVEEVERIGRKIVKGLRTEAREGIDEVRRYVRQQQANPLIGQTSYSSTLHGTASENDDARSECGSVVASLVGYCSPRGGL